MTDDVERHPIHFIRNLCADRSAAEVERAEDNFRAVLALLATEARERIAARRGQPDSTLWRQDSRIRAEANTPPPL